MPGRDGYDGWRVLVPRRGGRDGLHVLIGPALLGDGTKVFTGPRTALRLMDAGVLPAPAGTLPVARSSTGRADRS